MPQKRNPYALAVVRGGTNTLVGRVAGALASQRTPSARTDNWLHAYGETAGAVDLARRVVALGAAVIETLEVDGGRLAAGAGAHFSCTTDVTDALVLNGGFDYRSAYRLVGRAVADALDAGRTALNPDDFAGTGVDGLSDALDPARAVTARTQPGGSAPERVREHATVLAERVAAGQRWAASRRTHHQAAENALVNAARTLAAR